MRWNICHSHRLGSVRLDMDSPLHSLPFTFEHFMKLLLSLQGRISKIEKRIETRCRCVAAETAKVAGQVRRMAEVVGKHDDQLQALVREHRYRSPPHSGPVESTFQSMSHYQSPPPPLPRRQKSRSRSRSRGSATGNGRASGDRLDLGALERQMLPVLRRMVDDAIAEKAEELVSVRSRSRTPPLAHGRYRSTANPPTRTTPTRRRPIGEREDRYDKEDDKDKTASAADFAGSSSRQQRQRYNEIYAEEEEQQASNGFGGRTLGERGYCIHEKSAVDRRFGRVHLIFLKHMTNVNDASADCKDICFWIITHSHHSSLDEMHPFMKVCWVRQRPGFTHRFCIQDPSGQVLLEHTAADQSNNHFYVTSTFGQNVGEIRKMWGGIMKELCTDADNFGVRLPMSLPVEQKATLLGATFLIDFVFFEDGADTAAPRGGLRLF